jgi:hypothetical protein
MTLTLLQRAIALIKKLHDALSSCSLWSAENEATYLSVLSSLEAEVKRMDEGACLVEGSDGEWECSECHKDFCFIDGDPGENHYAFCSFCGTKIVEYFIYKDPLDDEGGEGEEG